MTLLDWLMIGAAAYCFAVLALMVSFPRLR